MPPSPFAASLRSQAGFTPPRVTTQGGQSMASFSAPRAVQVPALPNNAARINAGEEALIAGQLDPNNPAYIGNKYAGQLRALAGGLRGQLAGLGGFTFSERDDGSLQVKHDPRKLGDRQRQELNRVRMQHAARGMLSSSGMQQDSAQALQRMSDEAQEAITNYNLGTMDVFSSWQGEASELNRQLLGLYGEDARWAIENPVIPPAPSPAPPPAPSPTPTAPATGAGKFDIKTVPANAGPNWAKNLLQQGYKLAGRKHWRSGLPGSEKLVPTYVKRID